jgi:hypothetical protein
MADRLDPTFVRAQIALLRVTHPEIWEEYDDQLIADTLEGATDLHEFLAAVVRRMVEATAFAAGIEAMIDQMKARRDRFNQRTEAMRGIAFNVMQHAEVKKIELALATLSIRAGVPKVIVTDEAALPENCVRIKREPDRIAIKERLARGEPVPGAEISNSEPQLAVRVK